MSVGGHIVKIGISDDSGNALVESVRNMTSLSIPIPQPPVGGRPCSKLRPILSDTSFYVGR